MAKFITISPTHVPGKKEYAWNNFLTEEYISIGWLKDESINLTQKTMEEAISIIKSQGYPLRNERRAIVWFKKFFSLKIGDYVAVNNTNDGLFGIGIITSSVKFQKYKHDNGHDDNKEFYSHYREVKWIYPYYVKRKDIIFPGETGWQPYGTLGKLYDEIPPYIQRIFSKVLPKESVKFRYPILNNIKLIIPKIKKFRKDTYNQERAHEPLVEDFFCANETNGKNKEILYNSISIKEKLDYPEFYDLAFTSQSIDFLFPNLSIRSYNCLKRNRIFCIEDLLKISENELINIRGFGVNSLNNVIESIKKATRKPLLKNKFLFKSLSKRIKNPNLNNDNIRLKSIRDLNISEEICNKLEGRGIEEIGGLINLSEHTLINIHPIIKSSLKEIIYKLLKFGRNTNSLFKASTIHSKFRENNSYEYYYFHEPIEKLGLTVRSYNCLKKRNINTVKDLLNCSDQYLLLIPAFGLKSLEDVHKCIKGIKEEFDKFKKEKINLTLSERIKNPLLSNDIVVKNSIEKLQLLNQTVELLVNKGIKTIKELITFSEKRLNEIYKFNSKTISEIIYALENFEFPISFSDLDLSYKCIESLRREGIKTIYDFYSYSPLELLQIPHFDEKYLKKLPKIIQLDIPIEKLGLTVRVYKCLKKRNINTVKDLLNCSDQYLLLIPAFGLKSLEDVNNCIKRFRGEFDRYRIEKINLPTISDDINNFLEKILNSREMKIIKSRYGLFPGGSKKTLEEVGEELGVTRERIRQIQKKSIKKIHTSLSKIYVHGIKLLYETLYDLGGIARVEDILREYRIKKDPGPTSIKSIFRFITEIQNDKFILLDKVQRIWSIYKIDKEIYKKTIIEINNIIKKEKDSVPEDILIGRFLKSEFYRNNKKYINIEFIKSCLQSSKNYELTEEGYVIKSPKKRKDFIYLALKKLGVPTHFTMITEVSNDLYPLEEKMSSRYVHNILLDKTKFIRTAPGTYGLAEWDIYEEKSIADIIYDIFYQYRKPMHLKKIIEKVMAIKPCKRICIRYYLYSDKRFKCFAPEIYGLSSFVVTPKKIKEIYSKTSKSEKTRFLRDFIILPDGSKVIKYQVSEHNFGKNYLRIPKKYRYIFPKNNSIRNISFLDFNNTKFILKYSPISCCIYGIKHWLINNSIEPYSNIYIMVKKKNHNIDYRLLTEEKYQIYKGDKETGVRNILVDEIRERIRKKFKR